MTLQHRMHNCWHRCWAAVQAATSTAATVGACSAGLDGETVQLLQEFTNVVYISCNPSTLVANLREVHSPACPDALRPFLNTPQPELRFCPFGLSICVASVSRDGEDIDESVS